MKITQKQLTGYCNSSQNCKLNIKIRIEIYHEQANIDATSNCHVAVLQGKQAFLTKTIE